MRLLHSQTFELFEFPESPVPSYAILSHTWGDGEVTLQNLDDRARAERKAGWKKIWYCGNQAKADGWDYFWVDTCCIDKKSSAELSEAINSMFPWYRKAEICYVYLEDVSVVDGDVVDGRWKDAFMKSRWLTRGWTLQELISPPNVMFYSAEWKCLGSKAEHMELISEATRIDPGALEPDRPMEYFSIAQRMSWAAFRKTTRIEDRAYSLMGIFDVNMPMLYGEGMKAFRRLQEEIVKTSTDQSILAWSSQAGESDTLLFAKSPDEFADAAHIWPRELWNPSPAFTLSSIGLSIQLFMKPLGLGWPNCKFEAYLACTTRQGLCTAPYFEIEPAQRYSAVKITSFDRPHIYFRVSPIYYKPQKGTGQGRYTNIVLADRSSSIRWTWHGHRLARELFPGQMFLIHSHQLFEPYDWHPGEAWDPRTRLFMVPKKAASDLVIIGAMAFRPPELETDTDPQIGIAVRIAEAAYKQSPDGDYTHLETQTELLCYDSTKISLEDICRMSSTGPYDTGILFASGPLGLLPAPDGQESSSGGHLSSLEIPIGRNVIHIGARAKLDHILSRHLAVIEFGIEKLLDNQPKARVEDILSK